MNKIRLGELPSPTSERDAIHVAVVPVTVDQDTFAGEFVVLDDASRTGDLQVRAATGTEPPIGMLDPFLRRRIHAGERVWMLLSPGLTTEPRHHWACDALDKPIQAAKDAYEEEIDDSGCRGCYDQ